MIVRALENYNEIIKNECYEAENFDYERYLVTIEKGNKKLFFKKRFRKVDDIVGVSGPTGCSKGPLPDTPYTPSHYKKGIETWDYTDSWNMDFLEGNIIKYITRWKNKGGIDDLRKALMYLQRLLSREENKND